MLLQDRNLIRLHNAGGPGHTLFASYSGALLVAGGSGITFVLSILADLLQKHGEGRSRLRVIEVVWSVADPCKWINPQPFRWQPH